VDIGTIIIVHCGYVESSRVCLGTAFKTNETYEKTEEAIRSLAGWLLEKYNLDNEIGLPHYNTCCKNNLNKTKYCSSCGTLLSDTSFDEDGFSYYISRLCCCTCDDWGSNGGWGDKLTKYNDDQELIYIEPNWDIACYIEVHENWNKVISLEEYGETHLTAYAFSIKTRPAPTIPSYYTVSKH